MLTPDEYFETLIRHAKGAFVICGLGRNTYEWWSRTKSKDDVFHVNGAMGYAGAVGIGFALSVPDQTVMIIDSDGGMTMNLSGFLTMATVQPPNVVHVLSNNKCYGTLNAAPLCNAESTDYVGVARAAGIAHAESVSKVEDLDRAVGEALARKQYGFISAELEKPDTSHDFEPPLPMPYEGPEMKYIFGRHVEQVTGRPVFGPQGF
jgi:thiamine pyrophosphate-dependent acetolactate synthase large subunit-like protein